MKNLIFLKLFLFFAIFHLTTYHEKGICENEKKDIQIEKRKEVKNKKKLSILEGIQDDKGIAIDIGAHNGKSSVLLSKQFYHVIAIENNKKYLKKIRKILNQSDINNVTICQKLIKEKKESKNKINIQDDKSITFKELLFDYVYENDDLRNRKIALIKCDLDGDEENILEDLLHFAYHNDCKVYITFNLSQWKSKKIAYFENLLKYFETNCSSLNLCHYLKKNPTTSLLFEPLDITDQLIKNNLPAVIIGYNQLTFIKNMVEQLEKYTTDIIIVDNNSTYPPLLEYYQKDFKYTLLRQKQNYGHTVYQQKAIQELVGDLYLLTDPDLQFHPNLPENFIHDFIEISRYFNAEKVGFALFIDSDDIRTDIKIYGGQTIKEWEKQFWMKKLFFLKNDSLELYEAPIDTTFCLINKKFHHSSVRVAGKYTCFHIPWHKNFQNLLQPGEYESYLNHNISTNWFELKE